MTWSLLLALAWATDPPLAPKAPPAEAEAPPAEAADPEILISPDATAGPVVLVPVVTPPGLQVLVPVIVPLSGHYDADGSWVSGEWTPPDEPAEAVPAAPVPAEE